MFSIAQVTEISKCYGLCQKQQDTVNARAVAVFGTDMLTKSSDTRFETLKPDDVFAVTFRFSAKHQPAQPTPWDALKCIGSGYEQKHTLVSVVKVVERRSETELTVQLEQPAFMSYGNGLIESSDRYILHVDGHVMYLKDFIYACDWNHHRPTWEHTVYPVLPEIVRGI